jgi:hypothetical protein
MRRMNIDTIGPFPEDTLGNAYIVVIIDTFTRFVELYKAPNATALTAARALVDHCGRYGIPEQILTDNGPQYYNELIGHLTRSFGMKHLFTVPYSHQENGLVERANKEVGRHLRAILLDHRVVDTWSESLPIIQRIINAKVHEATGVAPAALLFGDKFDLNRVLLQSAPSGSGASSQPSSIHEYVKQLEQAQLHLNELAVKNQRERDDKQRSKKRARVATEFATGSYVLVSYPDGNRPSKLHAPKQGPFRVLGTVPVEGEETPTEYRLFDSTTQTERYAGVHRLTPFHFNPVHTDPAEAALTDKAAFIIEAIHDHRPKLPYREFVKVPKAKLSFLVKYKGYEAMEWNTWANLRTNVFLHDYLRRVSLEKMIPKQFNNEASP